MAELEPWEEDPHAAEQEQAEAEAEAAEEAAQDKEAEEEELQKEEDEPRSVNSTMVAEWGYDRENEQLEVTFNNGRTENYDCTPAQWEEAKEAPSAGKWLHENML